MTKDKICPLNVVKRNKRRGIPMEKKWGEVIQKQQEEINKLRFELEIWKEKATMDYMTGVFNKYEGTRKLYVDMKECFLGENMLTVAFLDIDHLKTINDTLGHCIGDQVLKDVAVILKQYIGKKDYIFRFGGDEFIIVFVHATSKDVKKVCGCINKEIVQYNKMKQFPAYIGLSIGICEYRGESHVTLKDLLKKADEKMYDKKKRKGRVNL